MKMSDVFGLPMVVCRTNPQMITAKPTYNGKTDYYYATIRSPVELEVNYATHAINNHDRMVDEIAELREFVESAKFTMEKARNHHPLPEGHDCEMLRQQIERSSELLNK